MQSHPKRSRVKENRQKAEELLSTAPQADLWVLPELAFTGYQFADRRELSQYAEEAEGETTAWAEKMARKFNCHLVYGFPLRQGNKIFNASALVGKDGLLGTYQKTHLFNREKDYFDPGVTGFTVWDLGGARAGMMICFDWIFPESARSLALAGADLIIHPVNLVLTYCQKAMYARAVENGVFTVTANRVGDETLDELTISFRGGSIVYSNRGKTLCRLSRGKSAREECAVIELDLTLARDKQLTPGNHLFHDRRPDLYKL